MVILRAKLIIAGDPCVGKSAIAQAFHSDGTHFPKNYTMTTGVEVCVKAVNIPETSDTVELYIYDSAGKEMFSDTVQQHWQHPNLMMVVYDVTSEQSFNACNKWLERCRAQKPGEAIPGALVASKNDLKQRRVISTKQGREFANSKNLEYFECSAELLLNERLRLHTTVFGLAFSSCGKYLAACNNFGKISIFSIPLALAPEASAENYKPIASFEAHSGPIYCLISTENFLISGGSSEICGWRWKELLQKSPSPAWTLTPPSSNPLDQPETNALAYNKEDNLLFSGCGDSNIYVWDLESGTCKKSIKGHSDYIHSLAIRPRSGQCVSGSEDGTVRLWDLRSPAAMIHKIEPHKNEELNRPAFGKWIGCVGVDESEDWLVCGGGPSLSVWRLNSMSCTGVLETPNSCQQVAIFHDDSIISGGSEPFVFHWTINGDLKSRVPCTPSSVYAIEVNTKSAEHKVLGLGGTSSMIDMFTNFGYKAFSFEFN